MNCARSTRCAAG